MGLIDVLVTFGIVFAGVLTLFGFAGVGLSFAPTPILTESWEKIVAIIMAATGVLLLTSMVIVLVVRLKSSSSGPVSETTPLASPAQPRFGFVNIFNSGSDSDTTVDPDKFRLLGLKDQEDG